jgi:hypothetical protein
MARRLTREQLQEWAGARRGRYERVGGEPVAMSPERIQYARIKSRVWAALDQAIRSAGRVPSIQHYLAVRATRREVIHHRRMAIDIMTHVINLGHVALDPPGIAISVADTYPTELPG